MSAKEKRVTTCMQTQQMEIEVGACKRGMKVCQRSKSHIKSKLCFYCKKVDHFKKDCKKMNEDFEKWGDNNNDQARLAKDGNNTNDLLHVPDGAS